MKNLNHTPGAYRRVCRAARVVLFLMIMAPTLNAQQETRERLVSANWLQQHLNDPHLVLLDASPGTIYQAGHIPGSINYDIFTYGVKELPAEEIEKRYQSWGISPEKKIVVYDQGGTYLATRLFFSLEYYGFPVSRIFILDGGLAKWKAAGGPVTDQSGAAPAKGTFRIKDLKKDIRVDLPGFLEASGNPSKNVLLEALDPAWHYGTHQFFGRGGHVPNAVMLPAEDLYNADKTFKSTEEIKKILSYLDIGPEKQVLSHCGGGIAASVPFFALKHLLGYTNVKLFPGSLLEWASDQRELPLWTYDAPYLIRNAAWLQGWGGRMMRMYGITNLSFIDVRPPDQFAKGHVQYAVNIPFSQFRDHIHEPVKLSGIMTSAGVTNAQEAVILTGGGLTREAALAFVILKKLGQEKISLFLDPAENWAGSGFSMVKDSLTSEKSKGQAAGSGMQNKYMADPRHDIIITDTGSAKMGTFFPRVYIASGKNRPTVAPAGKMVHIPYTDLLQADGRPLPAKDIWNLLVKAGVPRYAELVCISDDPGEAAVNYVILMLMGFPDIKMELLH